jgi:acetoin utilization protein AcuB
MNTDVETVAPTDAVLDAREKTSFRRIHHLVVIDGQRIAGVVSSRDLKGVPGDTPIYSVMSRNAVVAAPKTTVREAANLLRGHIIGCLPVVEHGKLVGIVTITDLLDLVGRGFEKPIAAAKRWTLRHRGPRVVKQKRARVKR